MNNSLFVLCNDLIINRMQQRSEELEKKKKKLQEMVNEMDTDPTVVKLGDASIASPFTYKLSSIMAGLYSHIIGNLY